jgi:hypothetical protein
LTPAHQLDLLLGNGPPGAMIWAKRSNRSGRPLGGGDGSVDIVDDGEGRDTAKPR